MAAACFHLLCLAFYWVFDQCAYFCRQKRKKSRKKLLLVRVDALGDFILWLDSSREYRRLFPVDEYEIVLLGNEACADLARALPYFDRVVSLNRSRFVASPLYRLKLLCKIRREGCDVAIAPIFSREFLYGDSLIRVTGAPRRIGSVGDRANIHPYTKRISDRWYTQLVPAAAQPLMELSRNAEFLQGIGLEQVRLALPRLDIPFPRPPHPVPDQYYILCPGAGAEARRWPWQSFLELARRIHQTTGLIGVLCGTAAETELAGKICSGADFPLLDLTGKTSLLELAGLLRHARFLVSNETGAVHLAVAVSTPSVCILGGGHYGRFFPYPRELDGIGVVSVIVARPLECYACNWQCTQQDDRCAPFPCIAAIGVDEVWSALAPLVRS